MDSWEADYTSVLRKTTHLVGDQAALNRALKAARPNVLPLPNNFNFRANFGGLLSGRCFVVHSHFHFDTLAVLNRV